MDNAQRKKHEPAQQIAPDAPPPPDEGPAAVAKNRKTAKPSMRWIGVPEVQARYGNISTATLFRWITRDAFPDSVTFGGRLRMWDERELDEFDARRKAARDAAKEVRRAARRRREEQATRKARGEGSQ